LEHDQVGDERAHASVWPVLLPVDGATRAVMQLSVMRV
jgi:hypothetical protein